MGKRRDRASRTDDADREVWRAVVEAGSFSAAARALGTTTSAVSKRIAALEARLAVRLVNRSSRRLAPTEAGQRFYHHCRRIADDLAAAEREIQDFARELRGVLRVSAPLTFSQLHLVPLLPAFLSRHPALDVELSADDRFVRLVEEGLDLAIRTGRPEDSSLKQRRLAADARVVCASPAYLARHGRPRRPQDLAGHACMRHALQAPQGRWVFEGEGGRVTVPVRGRLEVNHTGMIRDAAVAGLGVALLPRFAVAEALREGQLEVVLEGWRVPPPVGIYALFPAGRHEPVAVRALIEFLAAELPPRLSPRRD